MFLTNLIAQFLTVSFLSLFSRSLQIFAGAASSSHHRIFSNASILLTQSSLLSTVSSIGLKTFIECIRLQALGRAGLQQLQLDCRYLSGPLKKLAGGAGSSNAQAIEGLLNEVVGAGLERCFEPTLLEQPVLDRILAAMEN